jgi:DNA-binding HxlR family transcriptional regulator
MAPIIRPQTVDPCPIEPVVDLVFGRWTSHVLWTLGNKGRMRFTELRAHIPGITPKVLTGRLRQLERDGFVRRTYYQEMPPRVEYESTPLARSLRPVFGAIVDWADEHLDDVRAAQEQFDSGNNPMTGDEVTQLRNLIASA